MSKKIFYWKKNKYLMIFNDITKVYKQDFKELPVIFADDISNEEIFTLLNRDKSPLTTEKMQKWIRDYLKPDPHTSMSVGDIIEHNGKLTMCDHSGWKEVKWESNTTPAQTTA